MTKPLEQIRLGAEATMQPDGNYTITFRITGLKEDDAEQIMPVLQPLVNAVVGKVLSRRGHVTSDYDIPGKPN